MHNISVVHTCGCFKRSDLENTQEIEDKDEALMKALEMTNHMNDNFCGKHNFEITEKSNNFIISFKPQAPTSCCGDGCCD